MSLLVVVWGALVEKQLPIEVLDFGEVSCRLMVEKGRAFEWILALLVLPKYCIDVIKSI